MGESVRFSGCCEAAREPERRSDRSRQLGTGLARRFLVAPSRAPSRPYLGAGAAARTIGGCVSRGAVRASRARPKHCEQAKSMDLDIRRVDLPRAIDVGSR